MKKQSTIGTTIVVRNKKEHSEELWLLTWVSFINIRIIIIMIIYHCYFTNDHAERTPTWVVYLCYSLLHRCSFYHSLFTAYSFALVTFKLIIWCNKWCFNMIKNRWAALKITFVHSITMKPEQHKYNECNFRYSGINSAHWLDEQSGAKTGLWSRKSKSSLSSHPHECRGVSARSSRGELGIVHVILQ